MAFYPKVSQDTVMTLELIHQTIKKDPAYLDHPDCPYSDQFKQLMRSSASPAAGGDIFAEGDEVENIDDQLKKALTDLERMAVQLVNAEASEKLNYLKTKTVLMEKLISLRERVFNLKELQEFRSVLLTGLDQICTPDQITDFMKRLDGVLGVGDGE